MTQARNIADAESRFVNTSGDTMTGALVLSGDPSTNLQASTKQYVDNGLSGKVSLSGSYSDPSWITSLAYSKLTGAPTNVSSFTNDSGYITSSALSPYLTSSTAASTYVALGGSYSNPSWITSLAYSKLTGAPTNVSSFTNDSGYVNQAGARSSISATGSLSYNSSTGVISYTAPTLATVATSGSYTDLSNKPTIDTLVPTQTGNSGKFLTTNGSAVSWATVDALPSQTGNSGKYLTTNGTTASWATLNVDPNSTTKGLYEHANTISVNYSITSGNNALSAGPVTVASGVSVTVPSGSIWTVV